MSYTTFIVLTSNAFKIYKHFYFNRSDCSGCATAWGTTSSGQTAKSCCSRAKRSAKPTPNSKARATTYYFCTPDLIQNV